METAGHTASVVGKQVERNDGAQLSSSFSCSQGFYPMEYYCLL